MKALNVQKVQLFRRKGRTTGRNKCSFSATNRQARLLYSIDAAESEARGTLVSVGDLGDGAGKTMLVELALKPRQPGRQTALTLALEYTDVTDGVKHCEFVMEVPVEATIDRELLELPGDPEEVELTRSALDDGRSEEGQRMLREQAEHLRRWRSR